MKKIRRDDEVMVLSGRDRGKRGRVLRVLPDDRLLVSGIHIVKRHTKPNPAINRQGGIIEKEAPIHCSNVAIMNPDTNAADKVSFEFRDGNKVRVYKSNRQVIKGG